MYVPMFVYVCMHVQENGSSSVPVAPFLKLLIILISDPELSLILIFSSLKIAYFCRYRGLLAYKPFL